MEEDTQGHWATLRGQTLQAMVAKTGGTNGRHWQWSKGGHMPSLVSASPYQHSKARSRNVSSLWLMGQGTTGSLSVKSDLVLTPQTLGSSSLSVSKVGDSRRPLTPVWWVIKNPPRLRGRPSVPYSQLAVLRWRLCDYGKHAPTDEQLHERQRDGERRPWQTSLHTRVKKTYCIPCHDQDPPPCLSCYHRRMPSEVISPDKSYSEPPPGASKEPQVICMVLPNPLPLCSTLMLGQNTARDPNERSLCSESPSNRTHSGSCQ